MAQERSLAELNTVIMRLLLKRNPKMTVKEFARYLRGVK